MSAASPTGSVEPDISARFDLLKAICGVFHVYPEELEHNLPVTIGEMEVDKLMALVASEVRKARVEELRALSETEWAYDEALGGYLKERIAELEGKEQ